MAVTTKKMPFVEFIQLASSWKNQIVEKSLVIFSDQLAEEFSKTTNADITFLRELSKKIIMKESSYLPLGVPSEEHTIVKNKINLILTQYEYMQEEGFVFCYAPSSYIEGTTREQEVKMFKNCHSRFVHSYPNLTIDKCTTLEVDSVTNLFDNIEEFIVTTKVFSMRHIILMGHGTHDSYCIETAEKERTFLKLDTMISRINAIHKTHLTDSLERSTKTILFCCMCDVQGHCDAKPPTTQCVVVTADEKPDVLPGFDECFNMCKDAMFPKKPSDTAMESIDVSSVLEINKSEFLDQIEQLGKALQLN